MDRKQSFIAALRVIDRLLFGLAILAAVLFTTLYFVYPALWPNSNAATSEFIRSISVNLIPVALLFALSYVFLGRMQAVRDNQLYENIQQIVHTEVSALNAQAGVHNISYSYLGTDWLELLAGAYDVELCMFYASQTWLNKNAPAFRHYLDRGGRLILYLPNPKRVIGKFFGTVDISVQDRSKIFQTYQFFLEQFKPEFSDRFEIRFSDQGFNFMFARITGPKRSLFMISPYSNNYDRVDSPATIFDLGSAPPQLSVFADKELAHMKPSAQNFRYEETGLIVWRDSQKKVFVSSDVICPARCSFCFVESIQKGKADPQSSGTAEFFIASIVSDRRFEAGIDGTAIMLGGYTDPFLPKNAEFTIRFVELMRSFKNPVHIAARYTLDRRLDDFARVAENVVINFSVSSLSASGVEIANFDRRFAEAKEAVALGLKVAVFVRPVIRGVTLNDIEQIADRAQAAGISVATVGGLYVDKAIRARLSSLGLSSIGTRYTRDVHVLDSEEILRKIDVNDVDVVVQRLESRGFSVFKKASHRIEYFRAQSAK